MSAHQFLVLLGVLLLLAFLGEEVSRRYRFPAVLVLMGLGLLLGPLLGWFPAESFLEVAPHFGAMAFLLIVFEGGLDLELKAVLLGLAPGTKLAFAFFVLSLLAGTGVALAFGAALPVAIAAGIVVAPISGAIVLPIAQSAGFREELRTLIVLEAALADVLGILALVLFQKIYLGGGLGGVLALGSLLAAAFSVLPAVILGLVWPRVLRAFREKSYMGVLTFGLALVLWGVTELAGASGALPVLAFGLILANEREFLRMIGVDPAPLAPVADAAVEKLHDFIGQLTFLVRAFFFVFLGVVFQFRTMDRKVLGMAAVILLAFFAIRYALIRFLEWRTTIRLEPDERTALWFLQPRGLVSAVLAIEASHLGLPGGGQYLALAFLLILATNLVMPFGLSRLKRRDDAAA